MGAAHGGGSSLSHGPSSGDDRFSSALEEQIRPAAARAERVHALALPSVNVSTVSPGIIATDAGSSHENDADLPSPRSAGDSCDRLVSLVNRALPSFSSCWRVVVVVTTLAVLALASPANADEPSAGSAGADPAAASLADPRPPAARFSRSGAVALGTVSAVFGLGALLVDELPSPPLGRLAPNSYYHYPASLLAAVPVAVASPGDALQTAGLQVAFSAGALGLRYDGARSVTSVYNPTWTALELLELHQGVWAGYAAYRDARVQGWSDRWRSDWRPYTAEELVVAPFHAKILKRPIVMGTLSLATAFSALNVIGHLASGDRAQRAGPLFRDVGYGVVESFDAGVTEDALFRGFIYEELQTSLGRWPARGLDMGLFTAAHVPGEIGLPASEIAFGIGTRALGAFLFEIAYDDGGLAESVTAHSLFDTIISLGDAVLGQTLTSTQHQSVAVGGHGGSGGAGPVSAVNGLPLVRQVLSWSATF